MNIVCYCLQVNLGHYMRTLFFDIMQAEDVLFICIYHRSQRPERKVGNGEKQPCRLVKYYCHYEYGIIYLFLVTSVHVCIAQLSMK